MSAEIIRLVLIGGATAAAFGGGWVAWCLVAAWRRRVRYRTMVAGDMREGDEARASPSSRSRGSSLDERVIAYGIEVSQKLLSPLARPLAPDLLRQREGVGARADPAGVAGRLTDAGFWETRWRLALIGAVAGVLAGGMVTVELGLCLGLLGAVVGWRALPWALAARCRHRAEAMERDLSEMLDVTALGMRSGLSFDRSLQVYTEHFDTMLAEAFRAAHRQWACGLVDRDDALREVAASYASPLLARVIENVIRSLRFGSMLADNLEDAAREARSGYKARRQEQVAKAPVKMMVPTGVLILPAMLMLVLGPVLLELAGGL